MSPPSRRVISKDEETALYLHLLSPLEHVQRLGLIKICEHLQAGRFFAGTGVHHAVRGFVFGFSEETERWALKALVEFRDPADFDLIKSKLVAGTTSIENLSWAVAAFFATAHAGQIEEAFATKLISADGLSLLANTFAMAGRRAELSNVSIDIDKAAPLELKWGCLCFATGRSSDAIFTPKFSQIEQLAALNRHDEEEVAQYSLYAMFRQKRQVSEMTFPLHEVSNRPESVRKWCYRLLTRDGAAASEHLDLIHEVSRHEKGIRAQEGLALGLADTWVDGLETVVVDWFGRQPEERVQNALLSHMARHADKAAYYNEIILDTFAAAPEDSLRRSQLLSAAAGTPLYANLRRTAYEQSMPLDLFGEPAYNGGLIVNGNNNIIIGGQNNQAAGLATSGGKANVKGVSQAIHIPPNVAEPLKTLVDQARADTNPTAAIVVEEADRFFAAPTSETGRTLGAAIAAWGGMALTKASELSAVADYLSTL